MSGLQNKILPQKNKKVKKQKNSKVLKILEQNKGELFQNTEMSQGLILRSDSKSKRNKWENKQMRLHKTKKLRHNSKNQCQA